MSNQNHPHFGSILNDIGPEVGSSQYLKPFEHEEIQSLLF
jgi:hypothetical protein